MRTIRTTLKLQLDQAERLERLAEQCGLTLEQIASAIAVLALNRQIGEGQTLASQRIEHPTPTQPAMSSSGSATGRTLPDTGFLRLGEIIGRPSKGDKPGLPRLIPVSRSTWLKGVASGIYPQPVKLGGRVTAWRVEDIRDLIQRLGA